MKALTLRLRKTLILASALPLASTIAVSAQAGLFHGNDTCVPVIRNARCEYGPAHAQAKLLNTLDCAGLNSYAETSRLMTNSRIQALNFRTRLPEVVRSLPPAAAPEIPPSTEGSATPIPPPIPTGAPGR